jgi:hypothetical protein
MISVHVKTSTGRVSSKGVRLPEANTVGEVVMSQVELLEHIRALTELATERYQPTRAEV